MGRCLRRACVCRCDTIERTKYSLDGFLESGKGSCQCIGVCCSYRQRSASIIEANTHRADCRHIFATHQLNGSQKDVSIRWDSRFERKTSFSSSLGISSRKCVARIWNLNEFVTKKWLLSGRFHYSVNIWPFSHCDSPACGIFQPYNTQNKKKYDRIDFCVRQFTCTLPPIRKSTRE